MRVGHVRTDEQFRNFRRSPVIGDIVHYNSRIFKYSIFRGAKRQTWRTEVWYELSCQKSTCINCRAPLCNTPSSNFDPTVLSHPSLRSKKFSVFNIARLGRSEWLWLTKIGPRLTDKKRSTKSLSSIVLRKKSWTWIVIRLIRVKVPGEVV